MDKTARSAPRGSISPAGAGRIYSPPGVRRFYKPDRGRKARFTEVHKSHPLTAMRKKRLRRSISLLRSQIQVCRALRKSPSRHTSCVDQIFSQSCTKSRLCSEQAGPNSHPVLKARSAQTGGPERPGREDRAFHLLFPISFDKYNWLLKKFTPPGGIT